MGERKGDCDRLSRSVTYWRLRSVYCTSSFSSVVFRGFRVRVRVRVRVRARVRVRVS